MNQSLLARQALPTEPYPKPSKFSYIILNYVGLRKCFKNILNEKHYPCSFGWLSPVTFPPFFRMYVAPGEFSRASTSTFRDMLSDEGKCLLRLEEERGSGTQHTQFVCQDIFANIFSWWPLSKAKHTLKSSTETQITSNPVYILKWTGTQ